MRQATRSKLATTGGLQQKSRLSDDAAHVRGGKVGRSGGGMPRHEPCTVTVERLNKEFMTNMGQKVVALDEIDLTIGAGELIAIVGPSGCGKSTLLSIVAGLDAPTAGQVRIDDWVVDEAFDSMGVAFQKDLLLNWRTILDNVLLQVEVRGVDPRAYRDAAMRLLELAGIGQFAHAYPDELSGGMRQRVAVCRALLHDPALLLMDEPFAALDMLTRDQIALDFQSLWMEIRKTVLFVTHSISEAVFLADRVVVFTPRPGRIAEIIDIDLPRPRHLRDRDTEQFHRYESAIRSIMAQYGILKDN